MAQTSLPTQNLVEIKKIKDGVIYLKDGGLVQVIMVNGINFDLKSEEEQNAIIGTFQKFLNSLDFRTQFFIHSRKVNIQKYIENIGERKKNETNELLKIQIDEYLSFIKSFVEENAIISKNFFIAIPYNPTPETAAATSGLFSMFKFGKRAPTPSENQAAGVKIQENLEQLRNRVEGIIAGLQQMDLRATPLEDDELTELFYNLYNPQLTEKKGVTVQ